MDMYVFFCWQYHCAAGICRLPSGSHRAQPVVTLVAVRPQGKDGGCEEHDATWSTPNFGPFAVREKSFTVIVVVVVITSRVVLLLLLLLLVLFVARGCREPLERLRRRHEFLRRLLSLLPRASGSDAVGMISKRRLAIRPRDVSLTIMMTLLLLLLLNRADRSSSRMRRRRRCARHSAAAA